MLEQEDVDGANSLILISRGVTDPSNVFYVTNSKIYFSCGATVNHKDFRGHLLLDDDSLTIPRKKRSLCCRSPSSLPWMRASQQFVLRNPNSVLESPPPSSISHHPKKPQRPTKNTSCKKRKISYHLQLKHTQMHPPEWILNVMMNENKAHSEKLISSRQLHETDLDINQARLLIPFRQVLSSDFLTEEESKILTEQEMKIRKTGLSVDFVDPKLRKHVVDLRKRQMSGNWYYTFATGWTEVIKANDFKVKKDVVYPLWSFRTSADKLCFALGPPSIGSNHIDNSVTGANINEASTLKYNDHVASHTSGECPANPDDQRPL